VSSGGDVRPLPPRGHYLAHEVGQLAGVSGERIGQWARRGYIRSSQSSGAGRPRVYSYQDVGEAMVVHELVAADVPLRAIRRTIEALRATHGDWPLTAADLHVAPGGGGLGAGQLVVAEHGALFEPGSRDRWQGVIDLGNLRRVAADLQRGGWVVRDLPELRHVEVDPDRLSGRPTIKGRRIPIADVAEIAYAPAGRRILRDDYDLTPPEIDDAIAWWQAVQRAATAA
jgi:uncharacterized protein (DUF433 family)/DNA-binding transcriptional MerR regulator